MDIINHNMEVKMLSMLDSCFFSIKFLFCLSVGYVYLPLSSEPFVKVANEEFFSLIRLVIREELEHLPDYVGDVVLLLI